MKTLVTKNDIITIIKDKHLKVTPQRVAIMESLMNSDLHPTAEQIMNGLKKTFPTISLATVYNTLEVLEKNALLVKLKISDDNCVNYDQNTKMHHHFYCKDCGKIYDVDISCDVMRHKECSGHRVEEVHGYFKGICRDCI